MRPHLRVLVVDIGGTHVKMAVTGASEIDALFPEADGVTLDYRGFDGVPVRTHFHFTSTGKISLTACAPIRAAA